MDPCGGRPIPTGAAGIRAVCTQVLFSKSQFSAGNYSQLDIAGLDLDSPAGYANFEHFGFLFLTFC